MSRPTRYDPQQDAYGVLAVCSSASDLEIRDAYRRLARSCHPDIVGIRGLARMEALNAARGALAPGSREAYDVARLGSFVVDTAIDWPVFLTVAAPVPVPVATHGWRNLAILVVVFLLLIQGLAIVERLLGF